jgi:hypothetical protein
VVKPFEEAHLNTQLRTLLFVCLLVFSLSYSVYAQQAVSIGQLREQIHKLTTINTDPATPLEVKNINRGFLEERRRQLSTLLRKRLDALQAYQATVGVMLSATEKQVLVKSISDIEEEMKGLEGEVSSGISFVPTAMPVEVVPVSSSLAPLSPVKPPSTSPASVQGVDDFNNWLSNRIDERIKASAQAKIDQRSNVNQTEAPSVSDTSTSLVDQSSASDLIGLALNLSGLANGNDSSKDKNSAAVTATTYALYSMFRGEEPLDPSFYNNHRDWRRLSFTLGFEKGQTDDQGNKIEDTTLAGAKYLIFSRRDASYHQKELGIVYENLKAAVVNFAQLNKETRNFLLFSDPTLRDKLRIVEDVRFFIQTQIDAPSTNPADKADFQKLLGKPVNTWFEFIPDEDQDPLANVKLLVDVFLQRKHLGPSAWANTRKALGDDGLKAIDQFIDARLEAFTNLNNAARKAIEKIRRAPQFSLSFQSKLQKNGADEYVGEAIFDYGIHDRINLTLNGGYNYKNSRIIGGDLRGARFAGQLQFQMTPEKSLVGRSPLYFYLASQGDWATGKDLIYKLQGKIKIPIAEGIDLPLSLTYSNRTELIDERDIRGQFGFTFDTAKLFRSFLSR